MKAINLLPREAQRSFGTVRSATGGTMVLFGALTAALVLVLAYALLVNDVRSKRSELDAVNARVAATQRQVANLKPYADLDTLRQSLLQQVRTLSDGRYDWPDTLTRVARALPEDATLTSFNGSAGTDSASPSISLAGCTPSHDAVAEVIDRLRSVKGVTGVSLQSSSMSTPSDGGASDGGASGAGTACGDKPETFAITVALKGSAAPAAAVPATGTAPATSSTSATPAAPTTTTAAPAGGSQ